MRRRSGIRLLRGTCEDENGIENRSKVSYCCSDRLSDMGRKGTIVMCGGTLRRVCGEAKEMEGCGGGDKWAGES